LLRFFELRAVFSFGTSVAIRTALGSVERVLSKHHCYR